MTLHERVRREAQALAWRARGVHTTGTIAVVVAVLALGAWALTDGRWLAWPRAVPLLVWAGALGLALLAWRLITRRLPSPPLDGVAYGIEAEQGLRPGSLRGALEIAADGATGPLGARAVADVETRLGRAAVLLPTARRDAGRRLVVGSTALLIALVGGALLSTRARDGLAAVLHPLDAYRGLLLEPLAFEALPAEVPRGMPLTVTVRAPGRARLLIARRTAGAAWIIDTVPVDARLGTASLALGALRAPLSLRVDDGRAPTLERDVQVGDRGWIGDLAIEARYPAYLARPDERLDLGTGVRVPRGATLRVQAATYAGANAVRLVSEYGDTIRFASLGGASDASAGGVPIEARLDVTRDARWTWSADAAPNARGISLPVELPEPLAIAMIPDALPTAEVLFPATDTTIAPSGVVRLVLGAADDHGLAEVAMLVSKERADGRREAPVRTLLERTPDPIWEGAAALSLDGRGLEAGDRLVIEVEAVDASPWRQRGRSRALTLRVPSASEQRTLARSLADSLMARADALAEAERALQRSTSEAARSRELQGGGTRSNEPNQSEGARSQSMSYERAEQMRSLAQQQRELGDKVENLQQGARELEQRLDASGALDKAMQERFRELQQMLRDAMTPEMQQRLSELEQNAERLSGSEVRQSLEQLAEQQRQMREQLEKSAEMLKRAALEGAMETLRDEAQELASAERALGEQLKRPSGSRESPTDARAARDLASRSERLQRDVQELTERLQAEGAQAGASKTQEAQPDVQTAREAMQRAAEQLRQEMATAGEQQAGQQQAGRQQQAGQQQAGQQQAGQQQAGQQQAGQQQAGQQQAGQQQAGQQQASQQQAGRQQAGQQQAGQQQTGQQQAGQQQAGGTRSSAGEQAERAADAMERAADQLAAARDAQVDAWKQDLSQQLDQTINETAQLARQQQQLADRAAQQRASNQPQGMQGEQGALQQGVQQAAERLEQAGRGSALLSPRSQRAMAEAQQRVQQATQAAGEAGQPGGSERTEGAMRDAADALNRALASLVRDRERVNSANSASGFSEMLEQMKQLTQQQGDVNGQMQGLQQLLQQQGANGARAAQQQARAVARQQREVAEGLQDVADLDPTGRLEALAREAQQVAQTLDRGGVDPATAARQQQLYRRLLDAGRFMEQEERDDQGPREARAGDGRGTTASDGPTSGRAAERFAPPSWRELRGLSAEERRLVYEYFRRLNGSPP